MVWQADVLYPHTHTILIVCVCVWGGYGLMRIIVNILFRKKSDISSVGTRESMDKVRVNMWTLL